MKARYRHLLDHSVNSTLSAIEIYNKPDFCDREQVFTVLIVVAWESLLKAKILKENRNKLTSLYVKDGRRYKRNRSGGHLTIGIAECLRRCQVSPIVRENIIQLVAVRDAAIHLTSNSPTLPYLTFSLGAATLRNYAKLLDQWFDLSLNEYNFYILPLGFSYPFQTISVADLSREPEDIQNIIKNVSASQFSGNTEDQGFHLLCELKTTLLSAKKITDATDFVTAIDSSAKNAVIVRRDIKLIDLYPFTWTQIWHKLKAENPRLKQNQLNDFIKNHKIKGNPKYSAYNFRNKQEEARGPGPSTAVIYNSDAVSLITERLKKVVQRSS